MSTRARCVLPLAIAFIGCGDSNPSSSGKDGGDPGGDVALDAALDSPAGSDGSRDVEPAASADGPEAEASSDSQSDVPVVATGIDFRQWKLTLPVADPASGWAAEVTEPTLEHYSSPPWFLSRAEAGGTTTVFRCPVDGTKTSSSTKFARTELREMNTFVSKPVAADWSMKDGHQHRMKLLQGITALTLKHAHQAVGQIHDPNNDVFMLEAVGNNDGKGIRSDSFQLTAKFDDATVKLPIGLTASPPLSIPLGARFSLEVLVDGAGKVTVTVGYGGRDYVVSNSTWKVADPTHVYFKAGNYIQSNVVDYGEAPGDFSEVVIDSLTVTHS